MSDVVADFMRALSLRSAAAPGLAFGAGVVSSVGPCLGTRVASLSALIEEQSGMRRCLIVAVFVTGLVLSYMLIASCAALCVRTAVASRGIYTLLAAGLVIFALRSLLQQGTHACNHEIVGRHASFGWAFFNGASLAFVASPCCTPVVASIAGLANSGTMSYTLAVAALFAIGHALPLVAATACAARVSQTLRSEGWGTALRVMNGGVLLALGGYYALLA